MKAGIINTGISLTDKGFSDDHYQISIASIRISPDGFSYALFDTIRKKYVKLESYDFQFVTNESSWIETLRILLQENAIHLSPCESLYLSVDFPYPLLIPAALYSENKKELFYFWNYYPSSHPLLFADKLNTLDTIVIYPLEKVIASQLNNLFPQAKQLHQLSALLPILQKKHHKNNTERSLFVQIKKTWFDLIIFQEEKLLFFNTFQYHSVEDFLYFLLYSMQLLSIDPEKQKIEIFGEVAADSALIQKIQKYVRTVTFLPRPSDEAFSYVFDELESHRFINLLNLKNCGL